MRRPLLKEISEFFYCQGSEFDHGSVLTSQTVWLIWQHLDAMVALPRWVAIACLNQEVSCKKIFAGIWVM
ncbi:hypothetical protein IQ259_22610 [Fortiea sp. LEGE XX443]|uniref:hypothetical protein n=1 Tax=Fortiea sp. LEGE XX443 TaxID=1828611 RepID=UPI00188014CD|nr:hypothetical protein [Fortiea sp. LEGE XX443]MBE9007776.1 hypothetical protein [Fortiea sp. LEGE XX443]